MFKAKYVSPLCPGEKITEEQLVTDRAILAFERSVERLSRRKFLGGLSGAAPSRSADNGGAGHYRRPELRVEPGIPGSESLLLRVDGQCHPDFLLWNTCIGIYLSDDGSLYRCAGQLAGRGSCSSARQG